jgi:hypothetical protein
MYGVGREGGCSLFPYAWLINATVCRLDSHFMTLLLWAYESAHMRRAQDLAHGARKLHLPASGHGRSSLLPVL